MGRLRTCYMYLILGILKAFIEQTLARQWTAVTLVFVCRLRTWCVFRIPGYIKTIFESTLTACFDVQAADLLHVSHFGCSESIH
jgi:hypothetical protein